ncbi:translin-like [Selaginella moellendorffii]|uniref:translin-like n=1 Tax=Selaginella moellendorffii TaxID=88036 RepID=UPI000D1C808E|nr:translin-like [Selaginella moellendorffii]|eukprot:XP_024537552.1 translin-like [Selaginella moellendorffii]
MSVVAFRALRLFSVARSASPRGSVRLRACSTTATACCGAMEQFESFRAEMDASNAVREQLRSAVSELDNATRLMNAALLPIHHSSSGDSIKKAKSYLPEIRKAYMDLTAIIKARPEEYYKYHDYWRNQTQVVVSLLAFSHWLETGDLLSHADAQELLELKKEDFFLDLDDYLVGLCNMSSELPRYVVNQVVAGAYDCPERVSLFLSDLYSAFRLLNLRNDHLRKRFDGLKYDLKKVEEILYDVKIRGLLTGKESKTPEETK